MSQRFFTGLVCVMLVSSAAKAKDWTQWRGPNHTNVAEAGQGVPAEWQSAVPGSAFA